MASYLGSRSGGQTSGLGDEGEGQRPRKRKEEEQPGACRDSAQSCTRAGMLGGLDDAAVASFDDGPNTAGLPASLERYCRAEDKFCMMACQLSSRYLNIGWEFASVTLVTLPRVMLESRRSRNCSATQMRMQAVC